MRIMWRTTGSNTRRRQGIIMAKERERQIPLDNDAIRILRERKEQIKKNNKDMKATYSSAIRDLFISAI